MATNVEFQMDYLGAPRTTGDPMTQLIAPPTVNLRVRRQPKSVYRRRRLGALAVAMGLFLSVIGMGQAQAERSPADAQASSISLVVQPGDTLWDLAGELAPDDDPRAVVARLVEHLGGPTLQIGQRIEIPGDMVG